MKNSRVDIAKYKALFTKEFLTEHHHTLKKNVNQIARENGCSSKTVTRHLELKGVAYILDSGKFKGSHHSWKGYGDISSTYWENIKCGARNRKIPLEVSIQEVWDLFLQQNRKCALSGQEIGFEFSKSNTASLDRIDSSKGYILENLQWVHRDINFAKQSLNNEEFIQLCKRVVDYTNEKD